MSQREAVPAPRARRVPARPHPARAAVGRAGSALQQWLARPLTSMHLIVAVFALLTVFGLVMVLSASSVGAYVDGENSYDVFLRQLLFCVPGLAMYWLGLRLTPRRLRAVAPASLVLGIASLVAVLAIGTEVGGSQAWIRVGGISVQPSEAVKVALTFWGAHVLVARRAVMHRWKYALSPVVPVAALICALLVLQPDLGMTITMGVVLVALLWFAGAPARLMATLLAGVAGGALVLGLTAPYRLARITSFLGGGGEDYLESGFQARQSLYALADGGLFGTGLGSSRSKWNYLPNAHNDFIFAIVGEELGFVGAFAVLALFATLAYTGFRIAARSVDPWLRLVVAVSTTWLVAQAAINIGYVVGLLPVTGLQLPLISSGGTSLVVTMFVFGVLTNAARHEPEAVAVLRAAGPPRPGLASLVLPPVPEPYRAPARRPSGKAR